MPISLEVDLYKRDQLLGHALTKDISIGGMMLQNNEPRLDRNDLIAIRLKLHGVEQTLRGLVIHTDRNYAGIMLVDTNKDVSRDFFEFLKEMEAPFNPALRALEK
jgi:hypothetical protein